MSSPGGVRGRAPARNAFCRILKAQNAPFRTYMLMLQTMFYVTLGGGNCPLPQNINLFLSLYTVTGNKDAIFFILTRIFGRFLWVFFAPVETGMNTPQSCVIYFLNGLMAP